MASPPYPLAAAALLDAAVQQFPALAGRLPAWAQPAGRQTAVAWAAQLAAAAPAPLTPDTTPRPRAAIFTRLFPAEKRPQPAARFIPLQPLALTEETFLPGPAPADPAAAYQQLEAGLAQALDNLAGLDEAAFLRGAYDALQRYAWCLPDIYAAGETAVSLFDHSRVAAALAPCHAGATEEVTAVLVSGDISGVQDFIYTITARGAASGLRGRSLYLQLLTAAIAQFILNQLHLPPTSLLYAGGGHFFLLAPAGAEEKLPEIQRRISRILLARHQGALYLALGSARLSAADFAPGQFGAAWQRLSQAVSRAKRQRFSELSPAELQENLFTPRGAGGGKERECRVCHTEVPPGLEMVPVPDRADETGFPLYKCPLCASLETLGEDLRDAAGLLVTELPPGSGQQRGQWQDTLHDLGCHVRVIRRGAPLPALPPNHSQPRFQAIDDAAWAAWQAEAGGQTPVLRHYLVNVTPHVSPDDAAHYWQQYWARHPAADKEKHRQTHPEASANAPRPGYVKPFDLLQQQAQGVKRLGVLRMDVDDLGRIFARGFGADSSLTTTVALSAAMSLFFEGWVGQLAAGVDNGRDVVYSIYSGGDDLFIVAAWDVLPGLAHRIAADLNRYAAGNPRIHVSGGISLHGGKFPLYQAARAAEAALDQAKEYDGPAGRKNALTFLGRTLPWRDFPAVQREFAHLRELSAAGAPRSLLQQLIRLDALYSQHERAQLKKSKEGRPAAVYWGPWHWLSAYQLTRMARQRQSRHPELAQAILALRDSLSGARFGHIKQLGLSARWAELSLRRP